MDVELRLRTVGRPASGPRAPLLVVLDGSDYVRRARLLAVLRRQVETGGLPAHRIALVGAADRLEAFSASARYGRSLLAALDELGRGRHVGVGSSLGALALLHAHRLDPRAFAGLFLQSGSFFRRRTDPQERGFRRFARIDRFVGGVLVGLDGGRPVPTTITCALDEENYANNAVLAQALAAQGYAVDFHAARGTHDLAARARVASAGTSAESVAMRHLIGLVLGTEDDWPTAFEALAARVGTFEWRGRRHELEIERVLNEPFDLRYKPRYSLVLDRVGWWYLLPREWLKKVALMDDVYLLNNPFTFQSMEKHSAYCAMMRLGLKVPDTWLIPHKQPPWNERFPTTAARYNRAFNLTEIGGHIGYPLYLKPFDGGQWRGVSRASTADELRRRYDESGEQLMHVQSAVDGFEVFARSLSIGAETKVMWFDPDRPMHDRYQVKHDFLTAEQGYEVETISKVVNAFFRWEFNSCESIIRGGEVFPIDYANASPDVAVTSLHHYFPWAIVALVRWSAFALAQGRRMRIDVDPRPWFEIGDRDDLSYGEMLRELRRLADEYFEADAYAEFCAGPLAHLPDAANEWFASDEFDRLLVATVRSTFPAHEHERFVAHYRGLLAAR